MFSRYRQKYVVLNLDLPTYPNLSIVGNTLMVDFQIIIPPHPKDVVGVYWFEPVCLLLFVGYLHTFSNSSFSFAWIVLKSLMIVQNGNTQKRKKPEF